MAAVNSCRWYMLLISFLLLLSHVSSYKILVFAPTIARSHMIANGRIADELAEAGHDVVLFEPDFTHLLDLVKNTSKLARRWQIGGFPMDAVNLLSAWSEHVFEEDSIVNFNLGMFYWNSYYDQMCKRLITDDQLMKALKAEKFEAYFGEQINFCGHGIAHALGIKIKFMISSCPVFETLSYILGYSTPYSYIPVHGMDINPVVSYWTRAQNFIDGIISNLFAMATNRATTNIFREKYGANFPAVEELAAMSDAIFVNTDEFLDIPRPVAPNMINVGGLGAEDYEHMELDEEFEEEMSKGEKGVIYFSLGTVVNVTLLPTVFQSVAHLAKAFPQYHFIARAEKEDIYSRNITACIENINIHDWIPQPAVLRHPRLRVFITHGGYNGLMEAARNGVPVITIPFMLDQPKNSRAVVINGWGVQVSKMALKDKPELLVNAVEEVLQNSKYAEKAQRIARLIKEKPFNATERLVKTTEFIIANGGVKELLMEGRTHSLVHYFNLDIILPCFAAISVIIFILLRFILLAVQIILPKQKLE